MTSELKDSYSLLQTYISGTVNFYLEWCCIGHFEEYLCHHYFKHTHLCGDTHAARNVHTEHHHCVFHILVVIIALVRQIEVITACACTLTNTHSSRTVVHSVLTTAEFTHPYLKKTEAIYL